MRGGRFHKGCLVRIKHSTPRVGIGYLHVDCVRKFSFFIEFLFFILSSSDKGLSEDHFKKLMDTITGGKREMEDKFAASVDKLRRKVMASQEDASEEVVTNLKQRSCQFRRKGSEAQFQFNSSVEDHVQFAKQEIAKLTPTDAKDQTIVIKATLHLDQGLQAIAC